jgi:hypothetical protein
MPRLYDYEKTFSFGFADYLAKGSQWNGSLVSLEKHSNFSQAAFGLGFDSGHVFSRTSA